MKDRVLLREFLDSTPLSVFKDMHEASLKLADIQPSHTTRTKIAILAAKKPIKYANPKSLSKVILARNPQPKL